MDHTILLLFKLTPRPPPPNARSAEASARSSLLAQILTPSAGDRLSRIRMVKESRATDVENRLIMLARSGQLRGRVDEEQLKGLLEAMSKQEQQQLGQGQLGGGGDVGGGGGGGYRVVRRAKDWDDEEGEEELDRVLGRG